MGRDVKMDVQLDVSREGYAGRLDVIGKGLTQTVGNWRLIFIAERSGLPLRRERHCAMPR